MEFYRRNLPRWQPEGAAIFLTWRLHGSMPVKPGFLTNDMTAGRRFRMWDKELDREATGPIWLRDGSVAQCVMDTLLLGQTEWKLYTLIAWVIMSNHVHILIEPAANLEKITRSIKNHSARLANRLLHRSGAPFWQHESYDRWIRDSAELRRIKRYVEWNPVHAGMVDLPEHFPWSSAKPVGDRLY